MVELTCMAKYIERNICTTLYSTIRFLRLYGGRFAMKAGPQERTNRWYTYIIAMMGSGLDTSGNPFVRGSTDKNKHNII